MSSLWRSPAIRLLSIAVLLGLLVWFVVALRSVVTPFAVAFGLAYFLNPLVNAFERAIEIALRRRPKLAAAVSPRTIAVGALCVVVVGVVVLVVIIALPAGYHQVVETAGKVPGYVVTLHAKIQPAIETLRYRYPQQAELVQAEVERFLKGGEAERLVKEHGVFVLSRVTKFMRDTVTNVVDVAIGAFNLFIIPIFAVYLLYDMNHIRDGAKDLVPPRFREYVYSRGRAVDRLLSAFVRGQITVCLLLGTFYAIALTVCGVPMGLVVGMIIGFFNLIPFMSTALGLPLAVALSLLDDQSVRLAIAVTVVFIVGQFVEGNFITPRIVGKGLGLHAVVVMLAVLAGGSLFGFIGMMLAVPVTAALSVFWDDLRELYLDSDFYRGGLAPPPAKAPGA